MGCYIWYNKEGPGRAAVPPSPLLAVPNVTTHPSTASVPTSCYSMWHFFDSKGLTCRYYLAVVLLSVARVCEFVTMLLTCCNLAALWENV